MAVTYASSVVPAETALVNLTGILAESGIARKKGIDSIRRATRRATGDGARSTG